MVMLKVSLLLTIKETGQVIAKHDVFRFRSPELKLKVSSFYNFCHGAITTYFFTKLIINTINVQAHRFEMCILSPRFVLSIHGVYLTS